MINFSALGEVIAVSFGAGVAIVLLFTLGTLGMGRLQAGGSKVAGAAMAVLGYAAVAAIVVLGLYLMLNKG